MVQRLSLRQPHNECCYGCLDRRVSAFKIALEEFLHGRFNFSKLNAEDRKAFQEFLDKTVYKQLDISTVDSLYLRMKGTIRERVQINGINRDIIHYGQKRGAFRLHGYYNELNYFVIYKIDAKHKVHKAR